MSNLPQPELDRSRSKVAPVPPANRPGRKPRRQQDKPVGPPPTPSPRVASLHRFRFDFEPLLLPVAAAVGVTPWTSSVELDHDELRVRFGPWWIRTPRANIEGAQQTGPYRFVKVAGPPHLSLADRGLTMATTRKGGVCIHFTEPVTGSDPLGRLRHPALTVTVEDPDELVRLLGEMD